MTVQSAVEAELPFLQAEAEALMVDTWAAFSPGGTSRNDKGMKVAAWSPEGTTPGKTQAGSRAGGDPAGRTIRVGETDVLVIEGGLHLPISAFVVDNVLRIRPGWEFQCTATGPGTDPAQVGRRWHVNEVPAKAYATARRLNVYEVPGLDLG